MHHLQASEELGKQYVSLLGERIKMCAFRRNIKALCASVIALVRFTKKVSTGVFLFCFSALCYGQSDQGWQGYIFSPPIVQKWGYGWEGSFIHVDSESEAVNQKQKSSHQVCGSPSLIATSSWEDYGFAFNLPTFSRKTYQITVYPPELENGELVCRGKSSTGSLTLLRNRGIFCPIGIGASGEFCLSTNPINCDDGTRGNPCNPITGDKLAIEKDITADNSLSFTRYYHSADLKPTSPLGIGWRHNYQTRWIPRNGQKAGGYIEAYDGHHIPMLWSPSINRFKPLGKSGMTLAQVGTEWVLQYANSRRDVFNADGLLVRIEDNNKTTSLNYNSQQQLVSVINQFGYTLTFTYNNNGLLTSITDTSGAVYRYVYDGKRNLTAVIYPDRSSANTTDNPRRIYHYENSDFPNHLTGITDENGQRFATYAYDSQGRAILTQHAKTTNSVGQETFELEYQ